MKDRLLLTLSVCSLIAAFGAVPRIREALDWIAEDLTRPENASVWPELHAIEPTRSRIELFDMIWWMYFRQIEPVAATSRSEPA